MKLNRIRLINGDEKLLQTILKGDPYLSQELKLTIPKKWSEFGKEIFEFTLEALKANPSEGKWLVYLPIETDSKTLIGTCGYKGGPDEEGMVEIGYEVAEDFRNQGYATEITELLVRLAFADDRVRKIQAHTLAEKNASVRVLEKCGFKFVKEFMEEEDGLVWKWERPRSTYQ